MLRLITIPMSHYCDKARWGLERAGLAYSEEAHLQIFHYLASYRHGRTPYVPVLVHDGGVVVESTEILRFADARAPRPRRLFPDTGGDEPVSRWVGDFDDGLGVDGRLWMYQELLSLPEEMLRYAGHGAPVWQRIALRSIFPVGKLYIQRRLGVDSSAAQAALARCMDTFDRVAQAVGPEGFLVGESFSAADLTFASLSAPLVLPPEYGIPLPSLSEVPPSYRAEVERFRQHPAGQLALRHYREERQGDKDCSK